MGIGTEVYVSVDQGRKAIGIELKPSYFAQAKKNLKQLQITEPNLFDNLMVS
jgi:tRNA/tmRNA/rRNA uracil-C5-methylase (TrmA/RlmC/RlmD family)